MTEQFPVLTVKGCGRFQQNLNRGFQFSLAKNGKFFSNRQEGENFKFHRLVLSKKIHYLSKKMTPQFPVVTVKGYKKFEQKANRRFQFS